MHENQNALSRLERRQVTVPLQERMVDVVVLLMPPVDDKLVSLPGFIRPEFGRPVALPDSPTKLIPERAGTPTQVVRAIHAPRDMGHTHWGLNE